MLPFLKLLVTSVECRFVANWIPKRVQKHRFEYQNGATESEYYITDKYSLIICYTGAYEENTGIPNSNLDTMLVPDAVTACFDINNERFIYDENTIANLYT